MAKRRNPKTEPDDPKAAAAHDAFRAQVAKLQAHAEASARAMQEAAEAVLRAEGLPEAPGPVEVLPGGRWRAYTPRRHKPGSKSRFLSSLVLAEHGSPAWHALRAVHYAEKRQRHLDSGDSTAANRAFADLQLHATALRELQAEAKLRAGGKARHKDYQRDVIEPLAEQIELLLPAAPARGRIAWLRRKLDPLDPQPGASEALVKFRELSQRQQDSIVKKVLAELKSAANF